MILRQGAEEGLDAHGVLFLAAFLLFGAALAYWGIALARRLVPARPAHGSSWTVVDLVAVVFLGFLAMLLAALIIPGHSVLTALLQTELAFLCALLPVFLIARSMPRGWAALGITTAGGARAVAAGVLAYALSFPGIWGVNQVGARVAHNAGWEGNSERIVAELRALPGAELALAVVLAVVLGPLLEELLFRGFLQSLASQRLGRAGGVIVSSLPFALLHGAGDAGPVFVLSLLIGWLRQRTQSLLAPWAVHGLNNGLMLYLALRWGVE